MLNDAAKEYLKNIEAYYDSANIFPTSFGKTYRTMLTRYYNFMIPKDASVLEIGCGSGDLLALIRAKNKVGVDISSKQMRKQIQGFHFFCLKTIDGFKSA